MKFIHYPLFSITRLRKSIKFNLNLIFPALNSIAIPMYPGDDVMKNEKKRQKATEKGIPHSAGHVNNVNSIIRSAEGDAIFVFLTIEVKFARSLH